MSKDIIAITGVSGFLGSHLLRHVSARDDAAIRVLLHDRTTGDDDKVTGFKGDLLQPSTLENFPARDCTVINLVYLRTGSPEDNLAAMDNLATACANAGIKRMIHCSTAVLTGRTKENLINEETVPRPTGEYETNKLAIERLLIEKYRDHFEIIILRPTAVFGAGGRNLMKMADSLVRGNRAVNYLRSCLFNNRKMNLVAVENVVAALEFFVDYEKRSSVPEKFIISDDEDVLNEYRKIEQLFLRYFELRDYPIPVIPVPSVVLSSLLRLAGRTGTDTSRIYSSRKLMSIGFKKAVYLQDSLKGFAHWYRSEYAT